MNVHSMRRREFLVESSRTALGFALLPPVACSQRPRISAKSHDGAPSGRLVADLKKQIRNLMEGITVPGLSIAIIKDAKLLWRRGFGVKDRASNQPVLNDTVFEAQSMSKPVFAYAVMKLYEKGVIDLDTPLTRYTSERFLKGDSRLDLITARHVLSHTSGLQNWGLELHFTPGERYLYSGEAYSYLQRVMTHLTGQPIESYMKANLFLPLGMASTGYIWNDGLKDRIARPHDQNGRPLEIRKPTATNAAKYAAAAALLTTPTDYAKFIIEVIDPPRVNDRFRLNKKSVEEMLRPQVKTNDANSSSWALGWQIQHTENGDMICHGGSFNGFQAFAIGSVERKSGCVIMTNGDNGAKVIQHILFGEPMHRLLTG